VQQEVTIAIPDLPTEAYLFCQLTILTWTTYKVWQFQ